jgi:hypothetical protein
MLFILAFSSFAFFVSFSSWEYSVSICLCLASFKKEFSMQNKFYFVALFKISNNLSFFAWALKIWNFFLSSLISSNDFLLPFTSIEYFIFLNYLF